MSEQAAIVACLDCNPAAEVDVAQKLLAMVHHGDGQVAFSRLVESFRAEVSSITGSEARDT
jgi:hypothetical protein